MSNPELTVLSHNIFEALTDPQRSEGILRFVEDVQPDIGVLHSGYWTQSGSWKPPYNVSPIYDKDNPVFQKFVGRLEGLGYEVTAQDEGDTSNRPDKTGFVGFVRPEHGTGGTLEANTRQGYVATVKDPETGTPLRIGGLHFTDIDEAGRLEQVAGLPELDALLTDANALHRGARAARMLRKLKVVANRIPDMGERDHNAATGIGKLWARAHLFQELVEMADGRTMEALEAKGLHEADPTHQPTTQMFGVGVAQIDHILYNPSTVALNNYRVHNDVRLADHYPLTASVRAK